MVVKSFASRAGTLPKFLEEIKEEEPRADDLLKALPELQRRIREALNVDLQDELICLVEGVVYSYVGLEVVSEQLNWLDTEGFEMRLKLPDTCAGLSRERMSCRLAYMTGNVSFDVVLRRETHNSLLFLFHVESPGLRNL